MRGSRREWIPSLFSGLAPGPTAAATTIRIVFFFCFNLTFLLMSLKVTVSTKKIFIFAGCVAGTVFIIKFFLYAANLMLDKSFEQSDSSDDDPTVRSYLESSRTPPASGDVPPVGISIALWEQRKYFANTPMTENAAADLIQRGFDPNQVFDFFRILTTQQTRSIQSPSPRPSRRNYGKLLCLTIPLPFSRTALNSVFPENHSIVYVIVASIFAFIHSGLFLFISSEFSKIQLSWVSIIAGSSVYSLLHPPEVEPYSTTRGDIYTGITRCYFFSATVIAWIITEYYLPDSYKDIASQTFKVIILLFPLSFFFGAIDPLTSLAWFLEWVGRYFLGIGGSSGLLHSIAQILRSTIVAIIDSVILYYNSTPLIISICVGVSSLFLNIPLTLTLGRQIKKSIISTVVISAVAFVSSYFSASSFNLEIILWMVAVFSLVFDILWPSLSSHTTYLFVRFRLFSFASRTISTVQLLTSSVFAPMAISICLSRSKLSSAYTGLFIVIILNRALSEPHLFALATLIQRSLFTFDFTQSGVSLTLFICFILCPKIFSVVNVMDYWFRGRLYLYYFFQHPCDDSIEGVLSRFAVLAFPGPDRVLSTPALVWSIITGSPFHSPQLISSINLPFPPRPNSFWDVRDLRSLNIASPYNSRLTEHPIEAPVYTSMTQALVTSLSALIQSGKLGIVESNDIFLFMSPPLSAFVHILSLEPHCVHFQLRGLEYHDETLCHVGEISAIQEDIRKNTENKICLEGFERNFWTRATQLSLMQYNVLAIELERAFIGIEKEEIEKWATLCYAKTVEELGFPEVNERGPQNDKLKEGFELLGIEVPAEKSDGIYAGFEAYQSLVFNRGILSIERLFDAFHGDAKFTENNEWANGDFSANVIVPSVRLLTLTLALVSFSMGPSSFESEEVKDFFKSEADSYVVAPVNSREFGRSFREEKMDLVSVEESFKTRNLLMFRLTEVKWDVIYIQKMFVRSFWASEACLQVFFGEDDEERLSIQEDDHMLHNLILQSCDLPIGYPALVSPPLASYSPPPSYDSF